MRLPGIAPVTSRVVRRLRGRTGPADIAVRTVTYAPAVTVPTPPAAVFFADELDRVTGVSGQTSIAHEMATLRGTTEFGPSMAYQLPEVVMIDGNLMRGAFRHEIGASRERLFVRRSDVAVEDGIAIAASVAGNQFFGHAIIDDLATALAAPEFGDARSCNLPLNQSGHVHQYRVAADVDLPVVWNAVVRSSWVFRDPYLNDSKVARLGVLRERLMAARPPSEPLPDTRLFVTRRGPLDRCGRAPVNEEAVGTELSERGWRVLDPTAVTLAELVQAFGQARVVAGVEGSQLAHTVLLCHPGTALVTLQPPRRFGMLLKDFADRLGMRFGCHVGTATSDGWTADIDQVLRLVDLIEDRAG